MHILDDLDNALETVASILIGVTIVTVLLFVSTAAVYGTVWIVSNLINLL